MLVLYEINCNDGVPQGHFKGTDKRLKSREVFAYRFEGGLLRLKELKASFPEDGSFHFRAKVEHPSGYVWADLVEDDQEVPRGPSGGPPHIKALPIFYDSDDEFVVIQEQNQAPGLTAAAAATTTTQPTIFEQVQEDHHDFFRDQSSVAQQEDDVDFFFNQNKESDESEEDDESEESESESESDSESSSSEESGNHGSIEKERQRQFQMQQEQQQQQQHQQQERPSSSGSGGFTSAKLMKSAFGMSSFLKKSAQAALSMASGEQGLPNSQQRGVLDHLRRRLEEKFDEKEHVGLLQSIWKAGFPGQRFQRSGSKWIRLGFRSEDPSTDRIVQMTGVLGLHCLSYHMEHYYGKNLKPLDSCHLKLAGCCLKTITRVASFLELPNRGFENSIRPYWSLFESGMGAFYEIVSMIMEYANQLLENKKCTSQSEALHMSSERVLSIFERSPKNVDSFHQIARSIGIIV